MSFKMHKIVFFSRKTEKILGFTSKFRQGRVTLKTGIFLFGLLGKVNDLESNFAEIYPVNQDKQSTQKNFGLKLKLFVQLLT